MCGIVSYFSNEKKNTADVRLAGLMNQMLFVDTLRGYHSTGLMYETSEGMREYFKKAVSGPDFLELPTTKSILSNLKKTRYLVGHNRAATRGEVKSENAHPFEYDHILGVHNGTLTNHHALGGDTHAVDSAMFYSALSKESTDDLIPRVNGDFNFIWHDDTDDTIHMIKNSTRPYCFAKLKDLDVIVGASEKGMLKWLVARNRLEIQFCWTPKDMVEYTFHLDGDLSRPTTKKHKEYVAPVVQSKINNNKKNAKDTGSKSGITQQALEFFLDSYNKSYSGNYIYYGYDWAGEEVKIYNCKQGEFETDKWYIGRGYWDNTSSAWRVTGTSVQDHPVERDESDTHICILCAEDKKESEVLFMDNAPICVPCAKQAQVKTTDLDEGQPEQLLRLVK